MNTHTFLPKNLPYIIHACAFPDDVLPDQEHEEPEQEEKEEEEEEHEEAEEVKVIYLVILNCLNPKHWKTKQFRENAVLKHLAMGASLQDI